MLLELKLKLGKAICELVVKSAVSELHSSRVLKAVLHHRTRTKTLLFVPKFVVRVIGECIQQPFTCHCNQESNHVAVWHKVKSSHGFERQMYM